jgi:hypothetical protein
VARDFFPLDEQLALAPGQYAPRLIEGMVRRGTWMPFGQVPEMLAFFTGVHVDAETVRRLTERAGAALVGVEDAAVARLEREAPPSPPGPAVQQLSADGAMVPLVGGVWAEVKTLAIGTVTQQVNGTIHTTDLSYCSRLTDAQTFARVTRGETQRRGTETAGVVCAVQDGAPWLQELIALHRPDAVRILDFAHAVQQISMVGQAVWGAGSVEAAAWLDRQCHTLKHDDPDQVLAAIRAVPVDKAAVPVQAAATRDAVQGYLESRRAQIAYAAFQAAGYPIGSGIVESANKLVVEARLKGSGMHWARENVNGMVALRALVCSHRWAEGWAAIRAQWQQERALRRAGRIPDRVVTPPVAAPPERPPLPPVVTPRRRPPQRLVVKGRPTADHPWRRRLLPPRPRSARTAIIQGLFKVEGRRIPPVG